MGKPEITFDKSAAQFILDSVPDMPRTCGICDTDVDAKNLGGLYKDVGLICDNICCLLEATKTRKCTCEVLDGETEKKPLEIFEVMEDCWGVLCKNCGALSHHARTREAAIDNWNEESLQRKVGYFYEGGGFEEDCIKSGKMIARAGRACEGGRDAGV